MPLTEDQRFDCENYVLRNWRCRLTPQRSRRLVRHALDRMPTVEVSWGPDWQRPKTREGIAARYWLRYELEPEARLLVKNSALLWLFLQYVLPVLIRLVIDWWLTKRRGEA